MQASAPSGDVVGSTRTDSTGMFLLPLAPGTYTVTPATAEGPITTKRRAVTVTAGAFVAVTLHVDTGIR